MSFVEELGTMTEVFFCCCFWGDSFVEGVGMMTNFSGGGGSNSSRGRVLRLKGWIECYNCSLHSVLGA